MSAKDLEQRARDLLAAEYERSNCKQVADWVISQPFDEMDVRHQIALDAIVAALRQQPAPVVDGATVSALQSTRDRMMAALTPKFGDAFDGDFDVMLEAINALKRIRITLARAQGVQS